MRDEVTAIKWLTLGAISASLPMCNDLIHVGNFEDIEGEREVLRSIFVGSFLSSVFSLPLDFSDEERRAIVDAVEEDVRFDVLWKVAGPWYVLLGMEDSPTLTHETQREVFGIHANILAKNEDPLRIQILNAIGISTRLALRLFSSYLTEFECPEEW